MTPSELRAALDRKGCEVAVGDLMPGYVAADYVDAADLTPKGR